MLSNCGHDENGRYSNGVAGDQTGGEWQIIPWYSRPWHYMFRHPDAKVRTKIAELAKKAAQNNAIGYDQGERYTFWTHLKAAGFDPSKIVIPCEADCSSGVAAIVKAVGNLIGDEKLKAVSIYCYTGNLRSALIAAGFECYKESKYLVSDQWLKAGDILLLEGHHTAINITDGVNIVEEPAPSTRDDAVHATYQVYAGGKWSDPVSDGADAGTNGVPIKGFALKVSRGHATYRVHCIRHGWYPWVDTYACDPNNIKDGMAGDLINDIDAIQIYYWTPGTDAVMKEAAYRVDTVWRGSHYSWQIDTDTDKGQDGYAGELGIAIDRVQVKIV